MIKHIHIRNFRSLHDVQVGLEPVTVLIGRSGTGKSNFVDAIRFLRDYLTERNYGFVGKYGGWERVRPAGIQEATLSYSATFDVDGIAGDFKYDVSFQTAGNHSVSEEKLSLGSEVFYHQEHQNWVQRPKVDTQTPPPHLILGTLTGIQEVTIAQLVLTQGIGCYDFPGSVLTAYNARETKEPGLSDSGDNFLQVFNELTGSLHTLKYWKEIVASVRALNRSVKSVEVLMPQKDRVVVTHDSFEAPFELGQEAEGFRRFLAHLLALYQSPPKQTLIFEQPEKGIHPGALQILADQFKSCPETGRGQVILTTHSPELLNHFEPETLRVVEIEKGVTSIGPVVPEQLEELREHLLTPGELLTVDPARAASAATS